jgi:hypothetical protein
MDYIPPAIHFIHQNLEFIPLKSMIYTPAGFDQHPARLQLQPQPQPQPQIGLNISLSLCLCLSSASISAPP